MTYADEVLADEPVGFWMLDESSGTTAVDSSGNDNNGTYVGSPVLAADSVLGIACPTFDGVDDTVTIPAISVTSWTIEAVARADAVVNKASIFGEAFTDDGGYNPVLAVIGLNVDSFGAAENLIGTSYTGSSSWEWHTIAYGPWIAGDAHHVALSYDGTMSRFYVDGILIGSSTYTQVASNDGWRIGSFSAGSPRWDGAIGGVALYDAALDAGRIAAHYGAAAEPPPAPNVHVGDATVVALHAGGGVATALYLGTDLLWGD